MTVALWGTHAVSFQADDLYNLGQKEPVVILLVGTLIKSYLGTPTISCTDAAKVYINPEIPEKLEYCNRLGQQMPTITILSANNDQYNMAFNRSEPEIVPIEFLNLTDPNEFLGKNMISTVTIMRLASEHWWFLACQLCHKKAFPAGDAFVCSNTSCSNKSASARYKVRLIGADASGEAEFVFFGNVAEQVIGKKLDILMRTASKNPFATPAEISALVSQKLTLDFTVNEKGLHYGQLSFQVNAITKVHMKTNVFEFHKLCVGSSSSSAQPSGQAAKTISYTSSASLATINTEVADKYTGKEPAENDTQLSPPTPVQSAPPTEINTEVADKYTGKEPAENDTQLSPPTPVQSAPATEKTSTSNSRQFRGNENTTASDACNSTSNNSKKRGSKEENKSNSARKKLVLG